MPVICGSIASRTRGSSGVVACASMYIGRDPWSITVAVFRMLAAGDMAVSAPIVVPGIGASDGCLPAFCINFFWSALIASSRLWICAFCAFDSETYVRLLDGKADVHVRGIWERGRALDAVRWPHIRAAWRIVLEALADIIEDYHKL